MTASDTSKLVAIAYRAATLLDGRAAEIRVLGAIIGHFNHETGQCNPSRARLARMLGMAPATVKRAIGVLEKRHKVLAVTRARGRSSGFRPNWAALTKIVLDWEGSFAAPRSKTRGRNAPGAEAATGGANDPTGGDLNDPTESGTGGTQMTPKLILNSSHLNSRARDRGRARPAQGYLVHAIEGLGGRAQGLATHDDDAARRREAENRVVRDLDAVVDGALRALWDQQMVRVAVLAMEMKRPGAALEQLRAMVLTASARAG